jgi:predicted double-glycine peptidase
MYVRVFSHVLTRFILLCAAGLWSGCTAAPLPDHTMRVGSIAGGDVTLPVSSMAARRFAAVVRQQYDFSCGSAALATLLTYQHGDAQSEPSVFLGMWKNGDRGQIRKFGFSLLDMKRYLQSRGMDGEGYRISIDQLAQGNIPGIALLTIRGYRHFVVIKGFVGGTVLVGDPALGLRTMPRAEFARAWNGIYFIISKRRGMFNAAADWKLSPLARYMQAAEPLSLQSLALMSPSFGEF